MKGDNEAIHVRNKRGLGVREYGTMVSPFKLKFYEPEEEVRENCQGLNCAYVNRRNLDTDGFHAIPPWDHSISGYTITGLLKKCSRKR